MQERQVLEKELFRKQSKLSNGGEMKLSTAKWLTPKENWIHGKGVQADLEVEAK